MEFGTAGEMPRSFPGDGAMGPPVLTHFSLTFVHELRNRKEAKIVVGIRDDQKMPIAG